MKIQFIVSKNSGSDYHRIINPLSYIQWAEGYTCELLWRGDDEYKIDCDVLIYNKYCATTIPILKALKEKGMKIVVDVDDMWVLPTNHINYSHWAKTGHSEAIAEHIKLADLVICTSELLETEVKKLNNNTLYIPNAFPYGSEMYKPQPVTHKKMTFLYMGGSTHLPDIELLRGKFKRIGSDSFIKENAEFVLAGYDKGKKKTFKTREDALANNNNFVIEDTRGEYDKMGAIFADTMSYRILPTTNLDEYINYYDQADVALCPLVDTSWNSYKSTLKIQEAACKAIPVICSKVLPYYPVLKDCPGILWVESPAQWLEHIKRCLKNPVQLIDMGKQLSEYCKKNYILQDWNKIRKDSILALL